MIELITQLSAIVAMWTAIYGINSWRREHIGRKRSDTAEEALALMYEAADAIEHIRHPISFDNEHEELERRENESDEQWQARNNANVAFFGTISIRNYSAKFMQCDIASWPYSEKKKHNHLSIST